MASLCLCGLSPRSFRPSLPYKGFVAVNRARSCHFAELSHASGFGGLQVHSLGKCTKYSSSSFSANVKWRKHRREGAGGGTCHASESEREVVCSSSTWNSLLVWLNAFYRFSRPHTVIGTTLSIVSVSLLAIERLSDFSMLFLTGLVQALVPALLMNIYIVGLNQLFDIEIDKINKPDLPLASGEFSIRTGVTIVSISAIMSFSIGCAVGSWPLFWALFISFLLGTAYSVNLPAFRWKRFAVVAATCILAIRAVVVQLAFYAHMKSAMFGRPAVLTRPLMFATAFMSFFSVVIALFKDIPDIDGDRVFGIRSFTVRLGQKKVFWICIFLLEIAYAVSAALGITSPYLWSKIITVLGHVFLSSLLWSRAVALDIKNQNAIRSFYMFIWQLFYAEYLLIPLVR